MYGSEDTNSQLHDDMRKLILCFQLDDTARYSERLKEKRSKFYGHLQYQLQLSTLSSIFWAKSFSGCQSSIETLSFTSYWSNSCLQRSNSVHVYECRDALYRLAQLASRSS